MIVPAYVGALIWVCIGGALHLGGLLACGVGYWVGQTLWFALFGLFWASIYTLATARGAPRVTLERPPLTTLSAVFA